MRPGICRICRTFIDPGFDTCWPCGAQPNWLDVVVPITYSEHLGQMHTALRGYKDGPPEVQNFAMPRLAAILWRFLEQHEVCVARAVGTRRFDLVTTVPSSTPELDKKRQNLRIMVGWCEPINQRYVPILNATGEAESGRSYDERRYVATRPLDAKTVLVIDDTWTAGGHAHLPPTHSEAPVREPSPSL